jgi:hypothetical protein
MKRIRRARTLWCVWLMVALAPALASTHPHDDPETKAPRNLLLVVDARARLRNGKAQMTFADLKPGQRLRATVERQHDDGGRERWRAFQVSLDMRT